MKSPWVLPVCCALLVTACASSRELEDLSRARVVADLTQRGVPDADAAIEEQEVTALLEDGLSEEDAVRLALGHNRQTRAALAQLGIGAGELAAAGLWANPMLHGKLLFFDGGTEIDLGISQSLGRFLLLPAMRDRSETEQQALEAQVAALVLEVVHRARKAHVQATQAWRDLELRVAEEAAARGADELMKDLERAGNIQPVRGATSAADLARRQLDTMDGERAWQHSREELNRACGLSSCHAQWELRPEPLIRSLGGRVVDAGLLDGLDLESVEDRTVEASLALRQSRARMDAQAKLAELNGWNGRWADTEVGAAALKEADSGTYGLGPSFSIPLPIADTGSAGAHAARARLQSMLEEYSSTVVELRSSARELSTRLRMLAATEQHAREVLLPAERRLVEETLRNFNAMQVGAFDVLHARAAEIEAERRHLELRTQTRLARLELETMLAGAGHLSAQGAKQ